MNPAADRLMNQWCEAVNRRDWPGVAALFADDYTFKDTRPLGWEGAIGPDQVAELPKSFLTVSEDFEVRFERLGGDEQWFAARIDATGAMLDGGGEFHWSVIHVAQLRGEKFCRTEVLDSDDVGGALVRLRELADRAANAEHRPADP